MNPEPPPIADPYSTAPEIHHPKQRKWLDVLFAIVAFGSIATKIGAMYMGLGGNTGQVIATFASAGWLAAIIYAFIRHAHRPK